MFFRKKNPELDKFAELLAKGTHDLFRERGEIRFSSDPKIEKRPIIESDGKICADGMEKFNNEPTYVSAINFYANKKDMAKKKTLGAVILYVPVEYLPKLMKLLQYPPVDEENEDSMQDSCGTLCNIIAGRFKSEIVSAGYVELEMSHFETFRNTAFTGITFCFSEYDMCMIDFEIDKVKRVVLEVSMGVVPKR